MDESDRQRQLTELHLIQSMFADEYNGPVKLDESNPLEPLAFEVQLDRM